MHHHEISICTDSAIVKVFARDTQQFVGHGQMNLSLSTFLRSLKCSNSIKLIISD